MTARERYYLLASGLFIVIGIVILARAALAQVPLAGLLGIIFLALGVVRIRTYQSWKRSRDDT